jgi:hypothetical protein
MKHLAKNLIDVYAYGPLCTPITPPDWDATADHDLHEIDCKSCLALARDHYQKQLVIIEVKLI